VNPKRTLQHFYALSKHSPLHRSTHEYNDDFPDYRFRCIDLHPSRQSRTFRPTKMMESSMRNLFFAALAALSFGMATLPAYAAGPDDGLGAATKMQQQESLSGGAG
jgi:hypothetical protein